MKEVKSEILIFSVFQNGCANNEAHHNETMSFLKKYSVPCLELEGKYKGVAERSILIGDLGYRSTVEKFCKEYNQECYLEADADRNCQLVFGDGTSCKIGKLLSVSKEVAESKGSYSHNPTNGCYYITE